MVPQLNEKRSISEYRVLEVITWFTGADCQWTVTLVHIDVRKRTTTTVIYAVFIKKIVSSVPVAGTLAAQLACRQYYSSSSVNSWFKCVQQSTVTKWRCGVMVALRLTTPVPWVRIPGYDRGRSCCQHFCSWCLSCTDLHTDAGWYYATAAGSTAANDWDANFAAGVVCLLFKRGHGLYFSACYFGMKRRRSCWWWTWWWKLCLDEWIR